MHPFIHIFGMELSSYGLMLMLGFITAFVAVFFRARSMKQPPSQLILVCLAGACGALVGMIIFRPLTKLPQVLLDLGTYTKMSPGEFFSFLFGELVFYGGLIGGVLAAFLFCRAYKLDFPAIAEVVVPIVPLGHALGRVGCFLAGCCYGVETDAFWGVAFPRDGIPRVPVQLLEAGCNLLLCASLLVYTHRRPKRGVRVLGIYLAVYSVIRFALEFLRGDLVRGVLLGMSTSQFVSLLVLPVGVALFYQSNRRRVSPPG